MKRTRLHFEAVSTIVGKETIGLIVLVEDSRIRQIAIPCDEKTLHEFVLRMNGTDTHQYIPEVLWQVVLHHVESDFEIFINDLINGEFRALLINATTLDMFSLRAGDAILLSVIARLPIYIEKNLFMKQSVSFAKNNRSVNLPLNTLSESMLTSALDEAVSAEDYELASHLRDELKRRQSKKRK